MHKKSNVIMVVVDRNGVDVEKLLELRSSEMVKLEYWMMDQHL